VLVLLAGAVIAVTRAILRPLRKAAEAAARRPADEMPEHLAEVARDLLRSVNVVRGFADYYRQPGQLPAAGRDRMLRRVADEAARMETLIDGLTARSPAGSTAPDPQPTHYAAGSESRRIPAD
jgi:signal transduction histidine kinase